MSGRNFLASVPIIFLLAVGCLGTAPETNAASVGPSVLDRGDSARNNVIKVKRRGRVRIHLPIGPSYTYYDYPYYYSRGYYPESIGGYVYYPYELYRRYYPRSDGRCAKWQPRCVANWGHGNKNYYGCMKFHGCR